MPTLSGASFVAAKEFTPEAFPPVAMVEIDILNGLPLYLCSRVQPGTDHLTWRGNQYATRISKHAPGPKQLSSSQGIDISGTYDIEIADADFTYTLIERASGFQGASITVSVVFYDPDTNTFSADSTVQFSGLCNAATRRGTILTVSAVSSYDLRRKQLPDRPIQVTCPHNFPSTAGERAIGNTDSHSQWWNCGYSPDQAGGTGNYQSGTTPYVSCDKSKGSCVIRGMYNTDSLGRNTKRFGGSQWMPPSTWKGKSYTAGKTTQGINSVNPQKYQEFAPEPFGTTWVAPIAANVVGDPNFTTAEMIVANADLNATGDFTTNCYLRVVVDNLLVPEYTQTSDLQFRWYPGSSGYRSGAINNDAIYNGTGDPYGSLATISPRVYSQIQSSNSSPNVSVLLNARPIPVFSNTTTWTLQRSSNSAWVLLEILRRAGIDYSEWDMNSVLNAAAICGTQISYPKFDGTTGSHRRYGVSICLQTPTSVATIVSGIKDAARMMIVPNATGTLLRMVMKMPMGTQQPSPIAGSNDQNSYSSYLVSDDPQGSPSGAGYFAYAFNESNIAVGSLELIQSKIDGQPNVLKATIQDEDNDWTPDTVTNGDDVAYNRVGQKIQSTFVALGLPNYDQANRCLETRQYELYRGNPRGDSGGTWILQFRASFRCLHLNQGDIVSVSFQPLGLLNQPFRVIGLQPSADYEAATLTVQYHDDRAYCDKYGQEQSPYFATTGDVGSHTPYPWSPNSVGNVACDPLYSGGHGANFYRTFSLTAGADELPDRSIAPELIIQGQMPINQLSGSGVAPRIALQGTTSLTGGTIPDNTTVFGYVAAIDSAGHESPIQAFPCIVNITGAFNTNVGFIPVLQWPAGTTGWMLYTGTLPQSITLNYGGPGTPGGIVFGAIGGGSSLPIDQRFDHFILRAKHISHAGYLLLGPGLNQDLATTNTVGFSSITFGSAINIETGAFYTPFTNELLGYVIMACYETGGGYVPFVNLRISGNNGLACTIGESLGTVDLTTLNLSQIWFVALRTILYPVTGTAIQFADSGTNTSNWSGQQLRVIAGAGVSNPPMRIVAGNSTGGIAIDSPPEIPLDSTSAVIIEEDNWRVNVPQSSVTNASAGVIATLKAIFENTGNQFWFVQVSSAGKTNAETPEIGRPSRLFYWRGSPAGHSLLQGLNLVPNYSLAWPSNQTSGMAEGWEVVSNGDNSFSITNATEHVYSGKTSFRFGGGTQTIPAAIGGNPSAGPVAVLSTSIPYPLPRPGEAYYAEFSAWGLPSIPPPTNVQLVAVFRMVCQYTDGTIDTPQFPGGPILSYGVWTKFNSTLNIDPNKTPANFYTNVVVFWQNYDSTPQTVMPGANSFSVHIGGLSIVRIIDVGTEALAKTSNWLKGQGSIIPSESITMAVSSNSNTGGNCTIQLTWAGQSIEVSDGTSVSVVGGSATWNGLAASTQYYFYPYVLSTDGSVHFSTGDPPATPPTSPSSSAAIAAAQDNRFNQTFFSVTTPATAGGGGTGGPGGGVCPDADERVYEETKGVIRVGDVQIGDRLRGRDLASGEERYRAVRSFLKRPSSTWYTIMGCRVSPLEQIMLPGTNSWTHPHRVEGAALTPGPGERVSIRLVPRIHDDQNYSLVDKETGEEVLLMHNAVILPC